MTKSETAAVAVASVREILPLKTAQVQVNRIEQVNKEVFINMEDSVSFADLMADPKLFRTIQKDRSKALNALDAVVFDRVVFTNVDYANDSEVVLFKAPVLNRRERDRTPWQNENYEVRPIHGKWSWFRKKDGVQMGGLRDSWEAARMDCYQANGVSR
jgi:hypothetical protein